MHRRFFFCLIIIALVIAVPATAAVDLPARGGSAAAPSPSPTPPAAVRGTPAPTTAATPPAPATAACTSPCQCLGYSEAVSLWGDGGFTPCRNELPCEVSRSATGAPVTRYCYRQNPVATATTSFAVPAGTTPVNQIAPAKPTTSPTPFAIPQTTSLNMAATPAEAVSPGATAIAARFHPLVIGAGQVKKTQLVGSGSPYFSAMSLPEWDTVPLTFIEVDQYNTAQQYFGPGGSLYAPPVWVDTKEVTIDKSVKDFDVNFRYFTSETGVSAAVWQVSTYPFPDDPAHWQNTYIPGLVASGPVKVYHSDADGYRYFVINFGRVARHNAGDPPYYDGTATIDQSQQGIGPVLGEIKIPGTAGAIVTKKVSLGFLSLPVPSGLITIPAGEFAQGDLGNPNEGQELICADCLDLRMPGGIESALAGMDRTYYVRVVPIHAGGTAGIPAIPASVIVSRPHPCPPPGEDVVVRPPSAQVLWYMQPNFYANPGTDASYHWYYAKADQFHPAGLHTYEPPVPEDLAWYEKVESFFGSIINYFSDVMTGMSEAWNALQDLYVGITAKILTYTLTFGVYHCEDHPECTGVLKAGLQAVMAAYGIPPTLPTGPELQSLSTEYLIELGADQFGAGGVYDAYQELPGDVKQKLKGGSKTVAQELVHSQDAGMANATQQAYCQDFPNPAYTFDKSQSPTVTFCNYKIPDPVFNAVHPGTVMVYVSNPNSEATDRMVLEVSDSMGLYDTATAIVPPVAPGNGFAVPVLLKENYARFTKSNGGPCDTDHAVTITYPDGSLAALPCPQAQWMNAWKSGWQHGPYNPPPDTFSVTFATACGPGSCIEVTGLTPQSSGKLLSTVLVMDPGTPQACPTTRYLRYPPGWQMTAQGRSVASFSTTGDPALFTSPNGGFLRNSP